MIDEYAIVPRELQVTTRPCRSLFRREWFSFRDVKGASARLLRRDSTLRPPAKYSDPMQITPAFPWKLSRLGFLLLAKRPHYARTNDIRMKKIKSLSPPSVQVP